MRNSSSRGRAASSEALRCGPPSQRIAAHAVVAAQLRERRGQVDAAGKRRYSTSRAHALERALRRGDDHDARVGVLQQRQVGAAGPASRSRRSRAGRARRPAAAALLAALGVAHEAPVALDAQRARADHDRVHARAQRVEELAVGEARDRRGAPVAPPRGRRSCGPCSPRRAGAAAVGAAPTGAARRRARRRSARPPRAAAGAAPRAARCGPPSRDRVAGLDGVLDRLEEHDLLAPSACSASNGSSRKPTWSPRSGARDRRRRTSSGSRRGSAARAGRMPRAALELVDVVAGLAAEQLGEPGARARDEVHGERVGDAAPRRYVRFSRDRQARKRGGSKLHCVAKPITQPSRRSSVGGGDDEQRIIQRSGELEERRAGVGHRSHATRCGAGARHRVA